MSYQHSRPLLVAALAAALAAACSDGPSAPAGTRTLAYDFATGASGWAVAFADHPVAKDTDWRLTGGPRALPATLGGRSALFVSGENHSDDLFAYVTRQADGLAPSTRYRVRFRLELATRAPAGCSGVGGSPGESQYVKAGAAGEAVEHDVVEGDYRLSVDKGNQAAGGANALVLGTLGITASLCNDLRWGAKALDSGDRTLDVTSDAAGRVWLFAGVDSGFEGTVEYYVTAFRATFEPVQ